MVYRTEGRERILGLLKENPEKSFSAEEIFLKISHTGIGKSTVFRQLSKLCEAGEVRRLASDDNRAVRYQLLESEHCKSHLHLKCTSCGKLMHVDESLTRFFEEEIKKSKSFSIDPGSFIPGVCESCGFCEKKEGKA